MKMIRFLCVGFLICFISLSSVNVFGEGYEQKEVELKIKKVELYIKKKEDVYKVKTYISKYLSDESVSYETKTENYQQMVKSLKENKKILTIFDRNGYDLMSSSVVITFKEPLEDDEIIEEMMSTNWFRNYQIEYK